MPPKKCTRKRKNLSIACRETEEDCDEFSECSTDSSVSLGFSGKRMGHMQMAMPSTDRSFPQAECEKAFPSPRQPHSMGLFFFH